MDYCYTCRRTLNGALVCPGCGVYAPDITPQPQPPRSGAHARPYEGPFDPEGSDCPRGDGARSPESVLGPAAIAPTLHRGRAARRRQMARWKKSRRRAAAATAVALFGGGVTALSMSSHSNRGANTASAQNNRVSASLTTDTDVASAPSGRHAKPAGQISTHTVKLSGHGTSDAPSADPSYPSTDSATSVPLAPSRAPRHAAPRTDGQTGQTGSTSTATTAPSTGGGTSTGTGSGTPTGSGSGTTAGSGSGGGSTTTTTPPPATTPTTPPPPTATNPGQGPVHLCLLILCLD